MSTTSRLGLRALRQVQPSFRGTPLRQSSSILSRLSTRQVAAFSTSTPRYIFPPGPQELEGTVNQPAYIPPPSPSHGSYHWIAERAVSVAIIPLTLAPFAAGSLNPTTDALFIALMLVHSHMGFKSCVVDYFPTWSMNFWRKFMDWLLLASTALVGIGFYEFETNDVGVTEAIKRIWRAGKENDATVQAADPASGNKLGFDGKLGIKA